MALDIHGWKLQPGMYFPMQPSTGLQDVTTGQGYGSDGSYVLVRGPSTASRENAIHTGGFAGGGSSSGGSSLGSGGSDQGDPYRSETAWVLEPGEPGVPGTPPVIVHRETGPGWDASARTIAHVAGPAVATFSLSEHPNTAIGFADARFDNGAEMGDIRAGLIVLSEIDGSMIYPLYNGTRMRPAVGAMPRGSPKVTMYYFGDRFGFTVEGHPELTYSGPAPILPEVRLDAMLYTAEDLVLDVTLAPIELMGDGEGLVHSIGLVGWPDHMKYIAAPVRGAVPLAGAVAGSVNGDGRSGLRGDIGLETQVGYIIGATVGVRGNTGLRGVVDLMGVEGAIVGLPMLEMAAADGPYCWIRVELPLLDVRASEYYPVVNISGADLLAPRLGMGSYVRSGTISRAELDLPMLEMAAADGPYCWIRGTLPPLYGHSDDWGGPDWNVHVEEVILSWRTFTDPAIYVQITETLELGSTMQLVVVADAAYLDGLIMDPSMSTEDIISALIQSGLTLRSATRAPEDLLGQFGFDLDSGAATRYDGFEFAGFAFSSDGTYAYRPDGIYRLREGDDDGAVRNAMVDFGDAPLAGLEKSGLETVFIGMSTDGHVYLKMKADGGREKTYKVIRSHPTMKVRTGRGITAREWTASLEIIDATSTELESVEFRVAANGRKWRR